MSKASKNAPTTNLIVAYGGSILKDSAIYYFFTNDDYQTAFNALLDEKFYKDSSGKLFKIKMSKEEAEQKFDEDDFFNQHKKGDFICCGITNFVNNAKTLYDVKSAKFINHTEFVKPVKAKKEKEEKQDENDDADDASDEEVEEVKPEPVEIKKNKKNKNVEPPAPVAEVKAEKPKKKKNAEPPAPVAEAKPTKPKGKKNEVKPEPVAEVKPTKPTNPKGKKKQEPVEIKKAEQNAFDDESDSDSDDEGIPQTYIKPAESSDDDSDEDSD